MKKFLVSTTALVSIVAGAANADEANKVDVKMHGMVNFEYGVRSQKAQYKQNQNLSTNQKNSLMNNSARVSVDAVATADAGFTYGAVAGLRANADQREGKDSATTDNTYIFVDSSMGRVEVGSNYSASKTMAITGGTVARGTGGIAGDWDGFATFNYYPDANSNTTRTLFTETNEDTNSVTTDVYSYYNSTGLIGDTFRSSSSSENNNKITFYTPKVMGLQLGVSYSPDSDVLGDSTSFKAANASKRTLKNLFNVGLTYSGSFDQINLGLSAVGVSGTNTKNLDGSTTKHNLKGYAFGGMVGYGAFSVSGNYGTMNKKFFTVDTKLGTNTLGDANISKNPKFFSAAVAYVQGPFGVSANYYSSKNYNSNKFAGFGLSADYQLAPGIMPYAEFVQFNAKPDAKTTGVSMKNKGNVYLVGTAVSF